jgi:N-acyl-D-amino-acid deacylase
MNYDLIIRNGTVYDGTGAAPRRGDIAVQGGKIAEIADTIDATANEEIDAAGMAVTPGFVDVHTH